MPGRFLFKMIAFGVVTVGLCLPAAVTAQSGVETPSAETASHSDSFNLDSLLIKSVGGPNALETLRSMTNLYASGTVSLNGIPGTFVSYTALPDKLYLHMDLGTFSLTQAYDGQTAWQRDFNGKVSQLSGYEKKSLLSQVYLQTYSYLFPDRLPGKIEYRGQTEREGREYYEVVFKPFDLDTVFAYFDPKTGLQDISVINLDNLEVVTRNSDYRTVDGVTVAFASRSTTTGVPLFTEMTVDSMAFNVALDSSIFSPPESQPDYHFPAGADSVVIPIEYEAGHIFVEVLVNGVKRLRLMLDSGATSNLLAAASIEGLGLPVIGSLPGKGVGGYGQIDLVETDSMAIGQLTLYSQVAGVADLSALQGGKPFDGLLGYDFLSRFPILVDYRARRLVVYDPQNFKLPPGGSEVPFTLTMQIPTIRAELDGIPGEFLVDLGNAFGLMIHPHFAAQNDLKDRLDDLQDYHIPIGGVGGSLKGQSGYAASLAFGEVRIHSLRVILPESGEGITGSRELAGNMGNLLLEQFRLLFDYAHQRLVFYEAASSQD